ncbi:hypothetical protein GWK47_014799 [Chionoecetes opilio]|uniref:Uncharacterized protein n=1 Tax=Chionoecetes opilio TaxID=41210 RepID=A0A8J4XXW7_CHIOP|nr:hypothetical protein GWK47_014799 [Chionoecetes opilio]
MVTRLDIQGLVVCFSEVTVADVTPTAAPYNDHVYAHERLQPHDTVREDDETDPLASNHNTEPFSSALLVKERRAMEGRLGSNLTLQGSRVKGKGRPRGNKRLCTQTRSDALQNDSDDSTAGVIISDRDSINDIENDCGVDASTFALMNCVASLDDSVVKVEEAPANHVREPLEVYVGEDGATVTEGHDWATPGPSPTPEAGKSGDEANCSSVTHLDTMMTSLMLHGQHQEQASCLIREMMDAYKAQKMAWQAVEKYYANRSRK